MFLEKITGSVAYKKCWITACIYELLRNEKHIRNSKTLQTAAKKRRPI